MSNYHPHALSHPHPQQVQNQLLNPLQNQLPPTQRHNHATPRLYAKPKYKQVGKQNTLIGEKCVSIQVNHIHIDEMLYLKPIKTSSVIENFKGIGLNLSS